MKMIVTIVSDSISSDLSETLIDADYRVTSLTTTGSFFHSGATTLMIGVEDELVQDALQIIRKTVNNHPNYEENSATIYVLNVKNYHHLLKGLS